ncbi:MAG: cyclic nucleotide-binding domain-containing protein, partial [Gammaproteobacteria bacterium]|nr:cyclic nucleotide-binding domain-containing protein [Gammaproteobacteria bacterium]
MSVAKKLHKKSIDEKLLKKLVPLNALGADRLHELAGKADLENASPGRTLFKRGDTDAKTYYLLSGELEVQLANGQNVSIKADTPAALHPLLDARPRPATAVIKSHSSLLVIDTSLFEILVNYDQKQRYEVNEIQAYNESDWLTRFLHSLSAMNIPVKNIEHLMRRMQELPVRAGETVIRQTDVDSQHYYVVKEGRCVVTKHATTTDKTPIRIAELSAGIGFGEEALLADQPRSASVTMLTDGRLMRLTKADFTQLIADPALHYVTYAQAQQMVQAGALWLDARNSAEHRDHTINGSINIPLMALRSKIKELNTYGKYIAFCDTGNRAAAAAFLLRQLGFSVYVLSDGLRDVPAAALLSNPSPKPAAPVRAAQVDTSTGPLKVQPQSADTVDELARQKAASSTAQAEVDQLRAQLAAARSSEQVALQQIAQHAASSAREHDAAQAEQARTRAHIAELEALRATADRTLASHQEQVRELQVQADEFKLSLTAADAAYDSAQKELAGLSHTHTRVTENLQHENTQLKTRVAATATEVERMKYELERAVERNRTAEEALHSAEREIARLQAEADAAQRRAEESLRQANESESLQSTILKEVQRKIEAAELMRLEAEEQAQRLREAAELSRKRAEQESRKVAEAEAAR